MSLLSLCGFNSNTAMAATLTARPTAAPPRQLKIKEAPKRLTAADAAPPANPNASPKKDHG